MVIKDTKATQELTNWLDRRIAKLTGLINDNNPFREFWESRLTKAVQDRETWQLASSISQKNTSTKQS